jgi:hypothetical protein
VKCTCTYCQLVSAGASAASSPSSPGTARCRRRSVITPLEGLPTHSTPEELLLCDSCKRSPGNFTLFGEGVHTMIKITITVLTVLGIL